MEKFDLSYSREFFALVNGENGNSKYTRTKKLSSFFLNMRVSFNGPEFKTNFHQFPVGLKIQVLVESSRIVELFPTVYHIWSNAYYFVGVQFPTSPLDRDSKI